MIENRLEWIRDNPHLCVWPFANYDYRINDEKLKITVCCNLDMKMIDNEVDTEFIETMKQDIMQKKLPAACHLCSDVEKTGAQSERIKFFVEFNDYDSLKFSKEFTRDEFQVGMKFSNKCNLACRSCNSYDSSLWADKMKRPMVEVKHTEDISDNPLYWQSMTDMIRKKYNETDKFSIHPIGGETMIQPGFLKLLNWMIDENLAANTTILLTTSLAVNLEEWQEIFLKFDKIVFLSSIDSVHENYHYVRWPAKFSRIQRNLDEIVKVEKLYPGKYKLFVTPVFSLNNIFYINDFLDFWYNWAKETNISPYLQTTHINRPRPLMVESLRDEYRQQLITLLEKAITHPLFGDQSIPVAQEVAVQLEYFKSTLNLLKTQPLESAQLFLDYLKFTADYDKRTGTDSRVLNSQLFDLLSEEDLAIYDEHFKVANPDNPVYNINYSYEKQWRISPPTKPTNTCQN
jgi:hypothetical protein